jgi:hypothetical protein
VFDGHIDYYYSWGDKGLYMAAIVRDDLIEDGAAAYEGALSTRFQIALNPAGIICDSYPGLFFSLTPVSDTNIVSLFKHNWETSADQMEQVLEEESDYIGRYTFITDGEDVVGWNMECIIPWNLIATPDRYADLDETDEITLDHFNPKDENRKRAFCTATICYVQAQSGDGAALVSTARTCTDGDAGNFYIDSYDIILHFALPEEINNPVTETEYFTPETPVDDTTAETTKEDTTKADDTTAEQTKEDTTKADDTTEAKTDAPTTKAPETTTNSGSQGGPNTGVIIAIVVAAVVVIAAVVAVVVLKKKKK